MAELPQPQSYEQLLADMLSAYAAKMGINDFNVGSAVTSFFEVVALTTARSSGDVFQILRDFSVDRATGDALKRLATENKVTPITASPATGSVTVIDTSFVKISTKIYAGANPPNIGSTQIRVSDASQFTPTGSLYIGRGTPNIEGPLPYTSITPIGGYYIITLSQPTTKFHNLGESVILAQGGNRSVPANTIVLSPAVGATNDIQYSVITQAVILDGETSVENVAVSAQSPGASGNVPAGAIKQFSSPPFAGASVTNPLPFTTGSDSETDDQLRVRIKRALASKGLGTATAIQSAIIGATPSDEQATIVSTSVVNGASGSTVFVDDGKGYEAQTAGVGLESIVDSALGGEQFFQLATGGRQAPVAKAFLQSTLTAPFDLIGGDTLAIIVGEVTYQHVFANSDFRSPGGATAYEVTASINANTTLGFEAATLGGGMYVIIRAKAESQDSLQIAAPQTSGRNASVLLGFSSNRIETLRLYKNKIPLSKDGNSAVIFSQAQQLWSATIANGDTIILAVDDTAPITYTITNADFIATGLYTSVAAANSLESWVLVLNKKLTGVTVSIVGQQLQIVSNLGASNRASITIDGASTLVTKGMFSSVIGLTSQGKASDFTLDRNTAQFTLVEPLVEGDTLSSGSEETEARIESDSIPGGSITFAADGHVWLLIDNPGEVIQTGVAGNSLLATSKPSTNVVRYTSVVAGAFDNVQVGDYLVIWSLELDPTNRLEGRVNAVTSTTLDILVTNTEWAAAVVNAGVLYSDGFVVLRSTLAPQKFRVTAGLKTLDQVVQELQAQTESLEFNVLRDEIIVVNTVTKDTSGSLFVVTADTNGKLLNLPVASSDVSKDSLIAFYGSAFTEASFPLFIHTSFASGVYADPIDSYIPSFQSAISLAGRDPNELVALLHPYGIVPDAQPYHESVQERAISGATIDIENHPILRRLRTVDRFFLANPLDFGFNDTAVVVLDNDVSSKSFEVPFFRKALTNTGVPSNPTNFNAYDVDSGPTTNFVSAFGSTFSFRNYKVYMQAKKVLKPTPPKTAILYRSVKWGRSGEKINVGYVYPSAAGAAITNTVEVSDVVDIRIALKSGIAVTTNIDSTTQWNVTVTPNSPVAGMEQIKFTWNGVGSDPQLALSGGEYVTISEQTQFSEGNQGNFRVSDQAGFLPTPTSFSVQAPSGTGVAETNKATASNNAIQFFLADATTAAEIVDFVTDQLSDYVTATLVNDGGTDGSGVIGLSTYQDSGFTYESQYLLDGLNWIYSSNLTGSPNFTLKKPLDLPTDYSYAFNDGENIRLVPTTIAQVKDLISVLAVTGLTTVGTVNVVDRATKLELATRTLGSNGAIQIIGGLGNSYSVPVLDSAVRLDNNLSMISADEVSAQGVHSDQWFRLVAAETQSKKTLLSSNSAVTIVGNSPSVGQSTIKLTGRALNQRYFGKPRHQVRTRGRTFRIEKQGDLVCLSWNNVGNSPNFIKNPLNLNDSAGGTMNVNKITGTSEAEFIILTGNANFNEFSIDDLLTVSGFPQAENNGTFLVTGVPNDGRRIRVLNVNASNVYSSGTYTFSGNSTAGDNFTVNGISLIAGTDFAIGGTQQITAANLAAVIGTVPGVTASANGSVVTVTATAPSATITLAYSGSGVVTPSGATLVGQSFVANQFSGTTQVSEGDNVIIDSPFAVLNQGKFRVIRRYDDSIWFENANVVEEEVTLPANLISLGIDATTSLKVNATDHSIYLNWNGVGTEPSLGNALVGDVVRFGTDFASANQGDFMVLRSGAKLQEITQIQAISGGLFTIGGAGKYFLINSAGNVNQYYVWFNVNASNSDPAPVGPTGVQVAILSGDNATQVATKIAVALAAQVGLSATSNGSTVTVTTVGSIETTAASNFNVPAPFAINVSQAGRRTFLEAVNPSATNQSAVFVTGGVLEDHRPQMIFWEYEASVPGDKFVITGDILTLPNAGSYPITQVLDRDTAIIDTTLVSSGPASLNGRETAVFVEEDLVYTGYKHVLLVSGQPGSPTRNYIVFDTNKQYEKINESAGVQLDSLNKVDFNTVIRKGLDSYRYNTGLIAEANRIIYGDPRDPATYPGVGAAGADIFVREPLTRRIQIAINIRVNTGVPFAQTVEQVRTSVSSLVNSNPVGVAIAISAIVSAVNSIPGVRAVAISSPQYDSTHDTIFVAPSEKARIIDPVLDISVSQIGT